MDEDEEKKEENHVWGKPMDDAKAKKIHDKMQKFMAEISVDLLDEEEYNLAKKKMFQSLSKVGVPTTLTYMKAFREGYQHAMGAHGAGSDIAMLMLTCVQRIVAEMEVDMELKVAKSMENKPEK